jgi:S-DNA-T family DNA segregation ATPase FtsK/SpoIIIE
LNDRHCVDSSGHRQQTGLSIMGRSNSAAFDGRPVRFTLSTFVLRQLTGLAGFVLFFLLALAVAALATWNVMDPSYSYATSNAPTNILGAYGAIFADVVMQALGLSSVIVMLPVVAWALALIAGCIGCRPASAPGSAARCCLPLRSVASRRRILGRSRTASAASSAT